MAEETKLTLKIGVIASAVAAFVIFILNALYGHQTNITRLETNQAAIMKTVEKLDGVPAELAKLGVLMEDNKTNQAIILKRLDGQR